jgi:hypothetical protein
MLLGTIFAYQIGSQIDLPMGYIYGGIAGFFIYIALSDILPTIHSSEEKRYGLQTGFLFVGLIFGIFVSSYAHQYIDVGHAEHGEDGHDEDGHDEDGHDEDGHDEDKDDDE